MRRVGQVVFLLTLVLGLGFTAPAAATELPVTRVALFSSGVGSFEHTGRVSGDTVVRLLFTTDQINDVLKSMVVNDLDGGRVSGVTYTSQDPTGRLLKNFGVDLSDNPDLAALLNRLRGAAVLVHAPEPISGRILNVESHPYQHVTVGDATRTTEHILNVVSPRGIEPIPLTAASRIELTDPLLDNELNKALDVLLRSTDTEIKPVEISFLGTGSRRVRVEYILEAPVWKTAYRLDLREPPTLQGWAIVENSSGADWRAVQLELISGRPISFVQDLYTPLYVARPEVTPQTGQGVEALRHEKGMAPAADAVSAPLAKGMVAGERRLQAAGAEPASISQGIAPLALAETSGELFRFTIETPVDLPQHRSAMFPLVDSAIAVERVSVYNARTSARHPLNGAWLTNTTPIKLPDGPVTVFDAGTYAGDAQFENMIPGDRQLISYAVDLEVLVDPGSQSESRIDAVKITGGVLQESRRHVFTRSYAMHNKADQPRQIIIEHPYTPGRKLVEPASYAEKTPQLYRFETTIAPGAQDLFEVREERIERQELALGPLSVDRLLWYAQSGEISGPVRAAISTLAGMKQELSGLQADLDRRRRQIDEISDDQQRIRKNLESAGGSTPLGKRYLEKLGKQEDLLDEIGRETDTLKAAIAEKQMQIDTYLKGLDVAL